MRLRVFLLSLSLFLPGVDLLALELHGLYEAEVPVADQSRAARQDATARALSQVLVKVSGSGQVENRAPAEVAKYVQQYRYRRSPSTDELVLWVRFDARGVDGLLREQGVSVWGAARPVTLVWLAVEQGGHRELVGANDEGFARETLITTGERRGLPVRLPLLDLAEQSRIRPADIWGDFHQPIVEISERYDPQAVLVGRLYPLRGSRWAVRWSLYQGDNRFRWNGESEDKRSLLALGIEGAADRLSEALSGSPGGMSDDRLALDVAGVVDLAGLQRTLGYLTGLNVIDHIEVVRVEAEKVRFGLRVDGGTARLVNTLALGDTLTAAAVPDRDREQQYASTPVPERDQQHEQEQQEQGSRRALLYRLVP
ncbi:hypothetical protein SAMN03097708_02359 [Thiohalomonas denitrificans]|uniref:DUF2066 domain-containing protein n=2 Tax=Thiohalomonas denitrificans TaxID=415747 RepID=A0A1G5QLY5_9GAMM|nr:hypothetical protein SAMN03097708_02359 [Thiohalomonas denitrificans]